MNKRIAVVSAILEDPINCQREFNTLVAEYHKIVRGRMGIPFKDEGMSVVSITVVGTMDEINEFTGKLGKINHITVKTAISKKEISWRWNKNL